MDFRDGPVSVPVPVPRHLLKVHCFFFFLSFFLLACAGNKNDSADLEDLPSQSQNSSFCSVTENEEGVTINCADGTSFTIRHGEDGKDGLDGKDGADGKDGLNGTSCTVSDLGDKALLTCEDGSEALIEDGENNTSTGYLLTEVIDPCGPESLYDEVLLRFSNGDIVAHFSNGTKQHFAILQPGTYQTTDGTNCKFEVTEDKQIISYD